MKKLRSCTLLFTALCVCAAALAADEPKPAELKPGWEDIYIQASTIACVEAIVKPAMQAYQDKATASGRTDTKPFPEQELRDSVSPMCECITRRMAAQWTLMELADNALEKAKPFVEEALGGGQCKPGGMLGEILDHVRETKSD